MAMQRLRLELYVKLVLHSSQKLVFWHVRQFSMQCRHCMLDVMLK